MSITKSTCDLYEISGEEEWATIVIRDFEKINTFRRYGGELLIHSSFGSWAHCWTSLKRPFREELQEFSLDYLFGELMGDEVHVHDPQASIEAVINHINRLAEANIITLEDEIELTEIVSSIDSDSIEGFCEYISDLPYVATSAKVLVNPYQYLRNKHNPVATGFWNTIWSVFVEQLKKENESNRF